MDGSAARLGFSLTPTATCWPVARDPCLALAPPSAASPAVAPNATAPAAPPSDATPRPVSLHQRAFTFATMWRILHRLTLAADLSWPPTSQMSYHILSVLGLPTVQGLDRRPALLHPTAVDAILRGLPSMLSRNVSLFPRRKPPSTTQRPQPRQPQRLPAASLPSKQRQCKPKSDGWLDTHCPIFF